MWDLINCTNDTAPRHRWHEGTYRRTKRAKISERLNLQRGDDALVIQRQGSTSEVVPAVGIREKHLRAVTRPLYRETQFSG